MSAVIEHVEAESVTLTQGSPEWKAYRRTRRNASEAAAMLGIDPKTSRSELVRMVATGSDKEFSDYVQRQVIDKGHEYEEMARPWAEEIIGEELYRDTLSADVAGIPMSASLDGITMMGDITWEHKRRNKENAAALDAGEIPSVYWPQMEQGLMLSGAERCLFMVSDGDKETMRWAWYYPRPEVRAKLIPGWRQFEDDVAAYTPEEKTVELVAASVEPLPSLLVQAEGKVIAHNIDRFREAGKALIAQVKTELTTDQDFADAEAMVKALKGGEQKVAGTIEQTLAQATSINDAVEALRGIGEDFRQVRLKLEKLVKAEKERKRDEVVTGARDQIAEHVAKLNARLGRDLMPRIGDDLAGAIKGKKTLDSIKDAASTEVARVKIQASEIADQIEINLKSLTDDDQDWSFLFFDLPQVVTKPTEDFANLLASRVQQHRDMEAEREKKREAEAQQQAAGRAPNGEPDTIVPAPGPHKRPPMPAGPVDDMAGMDGGSMGSTWPTGEEPGAAPVSFTPEHLIGRIEDYVTQPQIAPRTATTLRKHLASFIEYVKEQDAPQ